MALNAMRRRRGATTGNSTWRGETATATACCSCRRSSWQLHPNPRNLATAQILAATRQPTSQLLASSQPRNCKPLLAATGQLLAPHATTVLATAPTQCKSSSRRLNPRTNSRGPRRPRHNGSPQRKERASRTIARHEGTSFMSLSPNFT